MSLVDNVKYTSLLFRSGESRRRNPRPLVLDDDDYYPILSYPKAEMNGDDAASAASGFLSITLSPSWRWRLRRRIQPGDALLYAPATYMFADEPMQEHFASRGHQLIKVDRWPYTLIEFKHMEIPCKV